MAQPKTYSIQGQQFSAPTLPSGLYVVATPIGNLEDISLRALATLAAADVVLAEDTRVSRKLLQRYVISVPLQAYHEHNETQMLPKILEKLKSGASVALISDAGTPLVSDPGFKLVRAVAEAGLRVVPLPGASAVMAGLVIAGLPTDRFFFEGFLSSKQMARRKRLEELQSIPATLVFFETGPRLAESLRDMEMALGNRPAVMARELTKTYETAHRGTLSELAAFYAQVSAPKGEIVVIVGAPLQEEQALESDVDRLLTITMDHLSMKDAVAEVTRSTGWPRKAVYARALALGAASNGEQG